MIDEADLERDRKSSSSELLNKIGNWISKGSGWTIDRVDQQFINIVKYRPMKGCS